MNFAQFYTDHSVVIHRHAGGKEIVGDCPFCEKTKHFYINPLTGQFNCKVCNSSGNAVSFLQSMYPTWSGIKLNEELKKYDYYSDTIHESETDVYPDISQARPLTDAELETYAKIKQCKVDVLKEFRCLYLTSMSQPCIIIPSWRPNAPRGLAQPTAWVRDRLDGKPLEFPDGQVRKYPVLKDSRHGLMGIPQFANADGSIKKTDNLMILLCEGVRDTLRARSMGFVATCTTGGAGHWDASFNQFFADKLVYICYDADEAGVNGAGIRADELSRVAKDVYICKLPYEVTKNHGKDLSDFLNDGGEISDIIRDAVPHVITPIPDNPILDEGYNYDYVVTDSKPQTLAQLFLEKGNWPVKHFNGEWFFYADNNHYMQIDEAKVEQEYNRFQMRLFLKLIDKKGNVTYDRIAVTRKHTMDVLKCLASMDSVQIVSDVFSNQHPPLWLSNNPELPDPKDVIAMDNCLLNIHLDTPIVMDLTPDFFTTNYLPFSYKPEADCKLWKEFLWDKMEFENEKTGKLEKDMNMFETLREFMGLLLTPCTHYHKLLFLIGQKRSGKSITQEIIRDLVGHRNCATTKLELLNNTHGLEPLVHKTVAFIPDCQTTSIKNSGIAVENLKSITGEDLVAVNPKGRKIVANVHLPIRFVIASNGLPKLQDSTGALASRFIIIQYEKSYIDCEDYELKNKLKLEIQGIFNWALQGYFNLRNRGRFQESQRAKDMLEDLKMSMAPIDAFLKDCCDIGRGYTESSVKLYDTYKLWCEANGHHPSSQLRFKLDVSESGKKIKFGRKMLNGEKRISAIGLKLNSEYENITFLHSNKGVYPDYIDKEELPEF